MLDYLGKIDASKWQDSNVRLKQPGTGLWFTDGPELQDWLAQDCAKLWIHGIRKLTILDKKYFAHYN